VYASPTGRTIRAPDRAAALGTTLEVDDGIVRIGRRVASAVLDPRRWWALTLLCGAFFAVLLDGTITIVALPSIGPGCAFLSRVCHGVLSAYALTFGGLLLLGGRRLTCSGARACFRPAATTGPALMVAGSLVLTQVELPEPDPRRLRRR
jgi:hypothetical protein